MASAFEQLKLKAQGQTTVPTTGLSAFDALKQKSVSQGGEVSRVSTEKPEGFVSKVFRGITEPVVTMVARPFQAAKAIGGAEGEDLDVNLPYYGKIKAPTTGKDILRDVGRGLETVSLGVGGTVPKVGHGVLGATRAGRAVQTTAAAIARPGVPTIVRGSVSRPLRETIKQGAAIGAKSGALFGAGAGLEEKATLGAAAEGAVTGAISGGVFGAAIPAVTGIAGKTFKYATSPKAQKVANAIDDLEDTYKDINRGWVQTRKASDKAARVTQMKNKSGTIGRVPERVLAEHGIIPEHYGTDFTTRAQAAKLKSEVTPLAEANRSALREAGLSTQPIGIDDLELRAISRARTPENIAGGIADDLENGIRKQMDLYRKNYGGTIPLETLDDIKSARWKRTGFSLTREDKLAGDIDYTIGKASQEAIEETAAKAGATDVAQLNRDIGDILEAAKFLENLDGRKILYGRMGTHMLRLAGTISGAAGGGIPGGIVGGLGGELLARMLRSASISTPVKRLILRDLQNKAPDAYIRTLNWLKKQGLDREFRLMLPPPRGPVGPNQGRPIPVFPQSTKNIDYVGSETVVPPQMGGLPSSIQDKTNQMAIPDKTASMRKSIPNARQEYNEPYIPESELPVIPMGPKPKPKIDPTIPVVPASKLQPPSVFGRPKEQGGALKKRAGQQAFGAVAGVEQDDEGNFRINHEKAALGVLGVAGFTKAQQKGAFKGFDDLTTKLLDKLKGRTTVSKQFIEDLTNTPDLRQPERELIRKILEEGGKKTRIAQFTEGGKGGKFWTTPEGADEGFGSIKKEAFVDTSKLFKGTSSYDFLKERGLITPKMQKQIDNAWSTSDPNMEFKISQDVAEAVLKKEGYGGAHWSYEDDLNPTQYQIWDKNLIENSDQINVTDFANKVKTELLPLKVKSSIPEEARGVADYNPGRYESIVLPDDLRGPVANYEERIYESPIKTSAGSVHFGDYSGGEIPSTQNYFAHTRVEDLPKDARSGYDSAGNSLYKKAGGDTRRVIELQSDLFQKGRLEGENVAHQTPAQIAEYKRLMKSGGDVKGYLEGLDANRTKELSKLEPYRNTWHERIIREEIKQAAKDGKTKLQFPTGETAMKIEGLGGNLDPNSGRGWYINTGPDSSPFNSGLTPEKIKVGLKVNDVTDEEWIITDVLGDGKFKAVPKRNVPKVEFMRNGLTRVEHPSGRVETLQGNKTALEAMKESRYSEGYLNDTETFDISGKVDTSNPIYKFYEKEVGRFLSNKFGAKRITDAQGVTWWEIPITKEEAKKPVYAFGKSQLGTIMGVGAGTALGAGAIGAGGIDSKPMIYKAPTETQKSNFGPKKTEEPKGSLARRNNNPLNLIYAEQPGAKRGDKRLDGTYWAKFDSPEAGMLAGERDIMAKLKRSPEMTIRELIEVRSPSSENDTAQIRFIVMDTLKDMHDEGIIKSLRADKVKVKEVVPMSRLVEALAKAEGYYNEHVEKNTR